MNLGATALSFLIKRMDIHQKAEEKLVMALTVDTYLPSFQSWIDPNNLSLLRGGKATYLESDRTLKPGTSN
jgi:hypothetical protein